MVLDIGIQELYNLSWFAGCREFCSEGFALSNQHIAEKDVASCRVQQADQFGADA